jgi:hypothetical protein
LLVIYIVSVITKAPGEKMNSGVWSKEEFHLFLERFFEWTVNGQRLLNSWGNFSKAIPTKVNIKCIINGEKF